MSMSVTRHSDLINRDGFDYDVEANNRTIQGTIAKFGTDWKWALSGGVSLPPETECAAADCRRILQRFSCQTVVDTIDEVPLPDVKALNAKIPRDEWELDLNGSPRPPYEEYRVIYLLNLNTAERYTVIGTSVGLLIAYEQLVSSLQTMRKLRGDHVVPVVKLSSTPWKTRYGLKQRPSLPIVKWIELGSPNQSSKMTGSSVKEPTTAELIDDSIDDTTLVPIATPNAKRHGYRYFGSYMLPASPSRKVPNILDILIG